jgi:hypothetical protein
MLSRRWCFLHGHPRNAGGVWEANITKVATVHTVEDLIATVSAIEPPSIIAGTLSGHQLFVFQEGAMPEWKDPLVHGTGGRWDLTMRFSVSSGPHWACLA